MRLSYGWVVVGAGALMTCVGMGAMFSLAVFLQPMSAETGWSRTGISTAMTLDFLSMGFAAFFWGALSDRFGTRIVVLAGGALLGAGLVAASQAASLLQFQLLFGVIVGVAAGSFYAPLMATASGWFEHNRSLAVALVSAGMGMAPLTVAPFVRLMITNYDWRTAMLVVGVVAWLLLIPAALLVRPPPAPQRPGRADSVRRAVRRLHAYGRAGLPHAAVRRHRAHPFRLLRGALRPDLPHGDLRHRLRHRADGSRQRLWRRGPFRAGRPHRARPAGRPHRAPSRCWWAG